MMKDIKFLFWGSWIVMVSIFDLAWEDGTRQEEKFDAVGYLTRLQQVGFVESNEVGSKSAVFTLKPMFSVIRLSLLSFSRSTIKCFCQYRVRH
jgi:hypothetical protein